jgi:hypothetical protein
MAPRTTPADSSAEVVPEVEYDPDKPEHDDPAQPTLDGEMRRIPEATSAEIYEAHRRLTERTGSHTHLTADVNAEVRRIQEEEGAQ